MNRSRRRSGRWRSAPIEVETVAGVKLPMFEETPEMLKLLSAVSGLEVFEDWGAGADGS